MSISTIFDAYRTILTGLSLDQDDLPLEEEAYSLFQDAVSLHFEEMRRGQRVGNFRQNINQVMRIRRGFIVEGTRDEKMKSWANANAAIIGAFMSPSNQPAGVRKILYEGAKKEERTAEVWIAEIDFLIEYSVSITP